MIHPRRFPRTKTISFLTKPIRETARFPTLTFLPNKSTHTHTPTTTGNSLEFSDFASRSFATETRLETLTLLGVRSTLTPAGRFQVVGRQTPEINIRTQTFAKPYTLWTKGVCVCVYVEEGVTCLCFAGAKESCARVFICGEC